MRYDVESHYLSFRTIHDFLLQSRVKDSSLLPWLVRVVVVSQYVAQLRTFAKPEDFSVLKTFALRLEEL